MQAGEQAIQSFVIKIRLSERTTPENEQHWYGYVTHVPSGKRQYFHHLDQVTEFMRPFMVQMGIAFPDEQDEGR